MIIIYPRKHGIVNPLTIGVHWMRGEALFAIVAVDYRVSQDHAANSHNTD